jgi:tRNA dimethylallyltransferase
LIFSMLIHLVLKMMYKGKRVLILGVTASGKSKLAFRLARELDAEIISVDSMKVYRRMDIGTAKPSMQVRRQVRYHLIDVTEPSESFSVAAFLELANIAAEEIEQSGRSIVAVGGTAMYIKAMLYGLFESPASDENLRFVLKQRAQNEGLGVLYERLVMVDPASARRIHPNDAKRIIRALEVYEITGRAISSFQKQWQQMDAPSKTGKSKEKNIENWVIIGLKRPKSEESSRINKRVKRMISDGLVDEVRSLLAEDPGLSDQARCAIGYAEIIDYLKGRTDLERAVECIKINTRRLAKSQRTWFKTFRDVNWIDIAPDESKDSIYSRALEVIDRKS